MSTVDYNKSLFDFLSSSPTVFHACNNIAGFLGKNNFKQLHENTTWNLKKGESYFVIRNNSAILAFTLGSEEDLSRGFRMVATHTDSPCLQVKPIPDIKTSSYHQLGVEVYGGSLLPPWFDRELSLAGRVCCATGANKLHVLPIDFGRPVLTLPSVAIHLNRDANSGNEINKQEHLPPILAQSVTKQLGNFKEHLLQQARIEHRDLEINEVLSFDIFCYDCQAPCLTGLNNEFISAPRLDNLLSCHGAMKAIASADKAKNTLLFCADHEENGSLSPAGAQGSFLTAVVERIIPDSQTRAIAYDNSFLISADNSHATHPNFMNKSDKQHEIHLNLGPVIKINANQRYATNSISGAVFKQLCREITIPTQEFVMRSDMACGSTIGPMTAAKLGVRTIDIGAPTLAMHSIREITGAEDPRLLGECLHHFFESDLHCNVL